MDGFLIVGGLGDFSVNGVLGFPDFLDIERSASFFCISRLPELDGFLIVGGLGDFSINGVFGFPDFLDIERSASFLCISRLPELDPFSRFKYSNQCYFYLLK